MLYYLSRKEDDSSHFWQVEIFENILVITQGRSEMDRKIEIKSFLDHEKIISDLEKMRDEKLKEGFTSTSEIGEAEENNILKKIEREGEFHIRLEIAESILLTVSDSNRNKLLKSLVRDCDFVLMGLGTADGEYYDGEDEFYPEMIQDETGLTPENARKVYKMKLAAYENLLKAK
ncbi:molybdate metabolism regulator [Leptospira adleri]|uniref:Molybdate metabolism regulator n=1 Tax=Leptospira adleri TaxID=2023186 RepID=A0A2M9YPZ5_9LEPT|nr:molybdate metabolism regulator [Leptospira adleri]PJZ63082.1 molybdate metabolism regulator [Leptospira adleri]